MSRALLLLLAAGALAGCAGPTYTINSTAIADAQGRAQRYCHMQNATAELKAVKQQGSEAISVYRCVPQPAHGVL